MPARSHSLVPGGCSLPLVSICLLSCYFYGVQGPALIGPLKWIFSELYYPLSISFLFATNLLGLAFIRFHILYCHGYIDLVLGQTTLTVSIYTVILAISTFHFSWALWWEDLTAFNPKLIVVLSVGYSLGVRRYTTDGQLLKPEDIDCNETGWQRTTTNAIFV